MASAGFWSTTSTKLGVVSALLGIMLSGAAIYKLVSPDAADRAAAADAMLQLQQLAPQLEMSYVSMAPAIYYATARDSVPVDSKRKNLLFLDYPLLRNELDGQRQGDGASTAELLEDTTANTESITTYLVLQNRGKATPENVKVFVKRYTLTSKVETNQEEVADYEKAISTHKQAVSSQSFSLPVDLETGKGVLIPLFIANQTTQSAFHIVSRIVYVPEYVSYTNPLTSAETKIAVRLMKSPVRLASGIEGRG